MLVIPAKSLLRIKAPIDVNLRLTICKLSAWKYHVYYHSRFLTRDFLLHFIVHLRMYGVCVIIP